MLKEEKDGRQLCNAFCCPTLMTGGLNLLKVSL